MNPHDHGEYEYGRTTGQLGAVYMNVEIVEQR